MTRVGRKRIAWLCLGALLSLQLAVAAYACPTGTGNSGAPMSVNGVPLSQPYHAMDQESPLLCEQHCVQASRSVDSQPHSLSPPVIPLTAVGLESELHRWVNLSPQGVRPRTAVDPPPLVRFGVLRI